MDEVVLKSNVKDQRSKGQDQGMARLVPQRMKKHWEKHILPMNLDEACGMLDKLMTA